MGQSFQLNSTILCEHLCWQEPKLRSSASVPFNKRLPGKFSHCAASNKSPHFPTPLGRQSCILLQSELNTHDQCRSSRAINDGHDGPDSSISSSPSAAEMCFNGVQNEQSGPNACVDGVRSAQHGPHACVDGVQNGHYAYASSQSPSDDVQLAGQQECTSGTLLNVAKDIDEDPLCALDLPSCTTNPSEEAKLDSGDAHQVAEGDGTSTTGAAPQVNTSRKSSSTDEAEAKRKVRRFSLNEPGLLKALQEARVLTPLEQENLDLLMKFKRTNDNLQGQLVVRAVRTEHLRDLENLLTDSYAELMWGPLTYRPVLAWILSTYLRERQAYLPHAVTLVGLYLSSDGSNDDEVSSHKWCLAGAVEISFNASGKPKDMQTPLPPEDAPFLSNMAVLKRFRRRGIGRELLKAAEQLVVQMGGTEMYLHCRMIDEAPLNMYKNAGYAVVETDSILSLLLFQRRRHLMYKTLAAPLHQATMVPAD